MSFLCCLHKKTMRCNYPDMDCIDWWYVKTRHTLWFWGFYISHVWFVMMREISNHTDIIKRFVNEYIHSYIYIYIYIYSYTIYERRCLSFDNSNKNYQWQCLYHNRELNQRVSLKNIYFAVKHSFSLSFSHTLVDFSCLSDKSLYSVYQPQQCFVLGPR